MRRQTVASAAACAVLAAWWGGAAAAAEPDPQAAAEKAIRQSAARYVQAFNRGDAAGVAACWSETGVYDGPAGERLSGRAALQEAFAALFAAQPGVQIEVEIASVRLIADDVALEDGRARVLRPDETPEELSYVALHVLRNGKWLLDSIRETAVREAPAPESPLAGLAWMVGEWADEGEGGAVETSVQWAKNGAFLQRSFRVALGEGEQFEGTQVIGWDPVLGRIRSWVFDSDGGFGGGLWTRVGSVWIVENVMTLPDGGQGAAIHIFTPLDDNTFTWQAVGRTLDGERLPDVERVTVRRK